MIIFEHPPLYTYIQYIQFTTSHKLLLVYIVYLTYRDFF